MKSFRAKDGPKGGHGEPPDDGRNGERDFRKEKRSNETHASTTDPDARLYRKAKGQESRLTYLGHALMENHNGLAVAGLMTHATGTAERDAASELSAGLAEGATLCGDKNYVEAFVEGLKARKIVPHVAINGTQDRQGAQDGGTEVAQSPGYAISLRCRKRVEEIFGWIKTTAGFTQIKVRGLDKVKAAFTFALAAYNIVRLPKLLRPTGEVCLAGGK